MNSFYRKNSIDNIRYVKQYSKNILRTFRTGQKILQQTKNSVIVQWIIGLKKSILNDKKVTILINNWFDKYLIDQLLIRIVQ